MSWRCEKCGLKLNGKEKFCPECATKTVYKCKKCGKVMDNGWNARYYGKSALSLIDDKGYKHGRILRVNIKAHRACFALFHGWWPEYFVDHVDGNRSNKTKRNLLS